MRHLVDKIFRISGGALAISATVFFTWPYPDGIRECAKILCAIFGLICIIAILISKATTNLEILQDINHELDNRNVDHVDNE